jgi:ferredoxin
LGLLAYSNIQFFSTKKSKIKGTIKDNIPENPARRSLLKGKISIKPEKRLPWVIDEKTFVSECTQCNGCIDVCETKIIIKDAQDFPKINF